MEDMVNKKKETMNVEEPPQPPSLPVPLDERGDAHPTSHLPPHHHDAYIHTRLVKMGIERRDRRPASGVYGNPKKEGHGGKFTWVGPANEQFDEENACAAIDEGDPNFVDAKDEARDAEEVVGFVNVAKVAGPQGVSRVDVNLKPN